MQSFKHIFLYLFLIIGAAMATIKAQNPILPPGMFMADPSAHVWEDDTLYVYGSVDEDRNYWCSTNYYVTYTTDMISWSRPEIVFSSNGEFDGIPYSDASMGAPDVQFREGKYYIYYCQDGRDAEGVAVSYSPIGPFLTGQRMDLANYREIDPAVFEDDDGEVYYLWGQFNGKIAKMNDTMTGIDQSTIIDDIVTEREHHFHEGLFMAKKDSLYYIIYADISRGGKPTCIGYSYSRSPMGPYTYGGVIIDNKFSDPSVWNNHGSIAEFKNQWYLFYQRSTNGTASLRKTCVEPIYFRKDGTIPEVEMTSQGASGPIDAFSIIDAAWGSNLTGTVQNTLLEPSNEGLTEMSIGDNVVYKYLDFKEGADSVVFKVSPGPLAAKIRISLGPWVNTIGYVDVPPRAGSEWITIGTSIEITKGVHPIWLSFSDMSDQFQIIRFTIDNNVPATDIGLKVDSFQFY
jgi:arabinoxylan arabinofuranohydrolase